MKKIIGIILTILSFAAFYIGLSFVFYFGGLNIWWSIAMPLLCYVGAILIMAFAHLVAWLLT